uniref:Saccharopine dehydrogenase NADP binding domain-containing protein n=1 Tax=Lotharella oceanica TaxID=641309 RepID=A0A7S2XAM0_9EUKA
MQDGYGPEFKDKTRTYAGCSALPQFLLQTFVLFPVWLMVVVPLMLIYQGIVMLVRLCSPVKPRDPFKGITTEPIQNRPSMDERKLDFVLCGATGFTGTLAAEYLTQIYGMKKYKWAIAGRKQSKLENLKSHLATINPEMKSLPTIVANNKNADDMEQLCLKTKLVMSTVGPYVLYGSELVAACARAGTHYVDITGEIAWVRHVIERLDATARTTGARIVNCCGHDSVPWDLVVYEASKAFRKQGDELKDIRIFDEFKGVASGGTIATLFESFQKPLTKSKRKDGDKRFDPMVTNSEQKKATSKIVTSLPKLCCYYSKENEEYVGPFVMAPVNSNVVKRSNALLGYTERLKYYEVETHSGCMAAWLSVLQSLWFATAIFFPPWKVVMMMTLPSPGQGPSREQMQAGYLKVKAIARSHAGNKQVVRLGFSVDPAYEDTARMMVECGLCSLDEAAEKEGVAGVISPMVAFGSRLTERLVRNGRGCHFSIGAVE